MARVLGQEKPQFFRGGAISVSSAMMAHSVSSEEVVKQLLPVVKRMWHGYEDILITRAFPPGFMTKPFGEQPHDCLCLEE